MVRDLFGVDWVEGSKAMDGLQDKGWSMEA